MSVNTDATSLSDKNLTMAPQCEAAPYTDCVTVHGYGGCSSVRTIPLLIRVPDGQSADDYNDINAERVTPEERDFKVRKGTVCLTAHSLTPLHTGT